MKKTLKNIDNLMLKIRSYEWSYKIEYKELIYFIKKESLKNSIELNLNKESKKSYQLKNLNDANNFLENEEFCAQTISMLGKKIEPKKNTSLLRGNASSFEDFFEKPSPSKIYSCLEDLVSSLEKNKEYHPILLASNTHSGIIEINPFNCGNWRCARLIQNYILEKNGFPSAVIPLEEAELYSGLMNGLLYDRYNKRSNFLYPSIAENNFNIYIASKVLNSAKEIEKKILKKKKY